MASKGKPTTIHVQTRAKSIAQAVSAPKAHVAAVYAAARK